MFVDTICHVFVEVQRNYSWHFVVSARFIVFIMFNRENEMDIYSSQYIL